MNSRLFVPLRIPVIAAE